MDGAWSLAAVVEDLVAERLEARRKEVLREELHGFRADRSDRRGDVDGRRVAFRVGGEGDPGGQLVVEGDALEVEEVDQRWVRVGEVKGEDFLDDVV